MGKGFDKGKLKGIFIGALFLAMIFPPLDVYASSREFELFDRGYEYYLSYQAEQAVETFRTFLREFPQSSAADAVLFWLGRSFLQQKAYEDGGKCFSDIKRQFPDSPFMRYAEREIASLRTVNDGKDRNGVIDNSGAKEGVERAGGMTGEKKEGSEVMVSGKSRSGEPQESQPAFGEERKEGGKSDTLRRDEEGLGKKEVATVTTPAGGLTDTVRRDEDDLVKKEAVTAEAPPGGVTYTVQAGIFKKEKTANRLRLKFRQKGYSAAIKRTTSGGGVRFIVTVGEFKAKGEAGEFAASIRKKMNLYVFPVEKESAGADNRKTFPGKGPIKSAKENEIAADRPSGEVVKMNTDKVVNTAPEPEEKKITAVIINRKRYTVSEISEFMSASSAALVKAEIQAIPWRSGSALEDFVNEQVLYDEAKGLGPFSDSEELKELSDRYNLTAEESEHIGRYLSILRLVQRKMTAISEERPVESLTVKYTGTDNQDKLALATKLQDDARNGKSFEEIAKLYAGSVTFSLIRLGDLQDWLKDSVRGLNGREVSVVWKRDGYVILRPRETGPLSEMPAANSGGENAAKTFPKDWIEGLKKNKGTEIVYE